MPVRSFIKMYKRVSSPQQLPQNAKYVEILKYSDISAAV